MKKKNNLLIATICGLVFCLVLMALLFLFPNKANNLKQDNEINYGDKCSISCSNGPGTHITYAISSGSYTPLCSNVNTSGTICYTESTVNANTYCGGRSPCYDIKKHTKTCTTICEQVELTCDDGYIANSDNSESVLLPVDNILGGFSRNANRYLALGENMPTEHLTAVNYGLGGAVNVLGVTWSVSGSGFSLSNTTGSETVISFNGSGAGTYQYKVEAKNETGSASQSGKVEIYNCAWSSQSGKWYYKNRQQVINDAIIQSGCGFFDGREDVEGGYLYTKYWSRCCSSPPAQDYGACYGDEPYYGIAKNVKWINSDSPSGIYKYRYDTSTISDESKCVPMPQGNKCTVGDVSPKVKEVSADKCEDTVSFNVDSVSRKCGDGGNSFYSISCNRAVNVEFDYGDDNQTTNREIIRGLGFQFGIYVLNDVTCKATFNSDAWLNEYNKVMNQLKTVVPYNSSYKITGYQGYQNSKKSSNPKTAFEKYISNLREYDGSKFTNNTASYLFELYTLASEIEEIVTGYNNYNLQEQYDEQANLDMAYTVKGSNSKTSYNYSFDTEEICSPSTKKVTSVKHTQVTSVAPWLTAPTNYEWTYKRVVGLHPKQMYIDKNNPSKIKEDSANAVSGGNKIYIDYYADEGQTISPINIKVTGLAGNNSSVTNNKCSINIKKVDMVYRSIDVSNPFINNEWKTGDNWLNNKFDFRNIIDKNIWSK